MRGAREYSVAKPEGVCRVAVIGDSFIFGFGVNDEEVISAVLEDALNKTSGDEGCRYEVINLSVSGFGQAEQLVLYRNLIRNYHPDEVVEASAYFIQGKDFLTTDDYYINDDHWRASGHRKAATELAELIRKKQ